MPYFETVTDISAFLTRRPVTSKNINKVEDLSAGSSWSTKELFAVRLVVRAARRVNKGNHLLPALREHLDETASSEGPIRELLEGPGQLGDDILTETEFVHRCGASLGTFWAALARFGGVSLDQSKAEDGEEVAMSAEGGEGNAQKRPYSSGSEGSASFQLLAQSKRVRTETERPSFVSSTSMRVGSSSPQRASEQSSQGSSAGYVSQAHVSTGTPELATLQIVSSFTRHILQACPPQHDTQQFKPSSLVEFSAIPSQLGGVTGIGAHIRATADGELLLYGLENGRYSLTGQCLALLEAKKRFAVINNGGPELTDRVLGQMTCEALALRLQQTERAGQDDENVFVIAAVRRYIRFLQFKISKSYIAALTAQNQDLTDFIELWATPWFDLKSPGGRSNAVDNIVALVRRQSHLGNI